MGKKYVEQNDWCVCVFGYILLVDIDGILDIKVESEDWVHSPTYRYIPTTIGETFKYTDLDHYDAP